MLLPEIETAILRMLAGPADGWGPGIDGLCSAHPEAGAAIRARATELEEQLSDPASTHAQPDDERPERIGPYRILDVLGEGGMGTVYLAEQKEPIHRRVALKVIKLGMDSKAMLARFEAERQALAMMEHDSIARVFDAGTTERGQPYFAMERVKGVPITEYGDRNKLGLRARIELLLPVCAAVQHAHHKGVIHRDLTPGNILVSLQDGAPMPKIIDFGLARATHEQLTKKTLYTQPGTIIGTPEYMSPEQAGLDSLDIDSRTDLYSLGVILYELLVGELPFASAALRGAGLLETQRVIREEEPPRPSTRLSGLGDDESAESARLRSTDIAALKRRLRGDLDWIVMKALEKDRTRRYGTAEALSDDLQRFIRGEPVLARPPSVRYRTGKLVRRYKVRFALAAALLLSLIGGVFVSTALWFEAASASARESQSATKLRQQKGKLERTLRETQALGLAKAAMDELRAEPTLALLLAIEAFGIERRVETISALHRALALCQERAVYSGHDAGIRVADATPDGQHFVTGTAKGQVRLWQHGHPEALWVRSIPGGASEYDDDITVAAFLGAAGDRILAGNWKGDVVLFDRAGNELDRHRLTPPRELRTGRVAPDRNRIALGYDGRFEIVELRGAGRDRLQAILGENCGNVIELAFNPDAELLAVAETEGTGSLWHIGTGIAESWGPLMEQPRNQRSVDFSADGRFLLVGAFGGNANLRDLTTSSLSHRTVTGNGEGAWLAFLAAGTFGQQRFVSVTSGGNQFRIFDVTGRLLRGPEAVGAGGALMIGLPSNRDRFAIGGSDGRIRIHDAEGNRIETLVGHRSNVGGTRFLDGTDTLLSFANDGSLREWSLNDRDLVWRAAESAVSSLQITRDGKRRLTIGRGGVSIWNEAGVRVGVARKCAAGLGRLPRLFGDRPETVALVSASNQLQVFELASNTMVLNEEVGTIHSLCSLPGTTEVLYFSSTSGQGMVLDHAQAEPLASLGVGPAVADAVAYVTPSFRGDRVAAVDAGSHAYLFQRKGTVWSLVRQLDVSLANVAAFAPDDTLLLVGTSTGIILAFDARTGERLPIEFVGHGRQVLALSFQGQGTRSIIGSASTDGTARLWARDGKALAVLEGPDGTVSDCTFTPDGSQLWTAHQDGIVRKWWVEPERVLAAATVRVCRALSSAERDRFAPFLTPPNTLPNTAPK